MIHVLQYCYIVYGDFYVEPVNAVQLAANVFEIVEWKNTLDFYLTELFHKHEIRQARGKIHYHYHYHHHYHV